VLSTICELLAWPSRLRNRAAHHPACRRRSTPPSPPSCRPSALRASSLPGHISVRTTVFIVFANSDAATMSALGRTAVAFGRATVRRASSAAAPASSEAAAARPAPRMPEGVDPAAFHPKEHAVSDMWRWRLVTGVASVPVFGYFCLQVRCVFALVWPARPLPRYFPVTELLLDARPPFS